MTPSLKQIEELIGRLEKASGFERELSVLIATILRARLAISSKEEA